MTEHEIRQLQDIPRPETSLTDILQCGSEVRNQVKYGAER